MTNVAFSVRSEPEKKTIISVAVSRGKKMPVIRVYGHNWNATIIYNASDIPDAFCRRYSYIHTKKAIVKRCGLI